jgi:hypothetical protein
MLTVNHATDGRVELRDLHKLLQEMDTRAINVGSDSNITSTIKKPPASTGLGYDRRRGFGEESRKNSTIAQEGSL